MKASNFHANKLLRLDLHYVLEFNVVNTAIFKLNLSDVRKKDTLVYFKQGNISKISSRGKFPYKY